ncbi:sortase [Nocardioides sp. SOB77]|uniref:Sortase n=1 Tax=Nocardioides oceani TaxID=3058369 RepID=A0ABT8FJS2_9ACTN|nr:sortase [Nocardioides oceani]MDN4174931.1 sortase [Nocardioides oceani]
MRAWSAGLLGLCGLGLLCWPFLQPSVQAHRTAVAQERLADELPVGAAVADARGIPVAAQRGVGDPLGVLRIPRLGPAWAWVAVEGTGLPQLALGPGHYRRTPPPGARGNVGIAAHRAGHGEPFADFDRLRPGDEVVFEQGEHRWTYHLETAPRIVGVDASWVLAPTDGRRLTLTTCWPRYGSSKRMFVRGRLVRAERRMSDGWQPAGRSAGDRPAAASGR